MPSIPKLNSCCCGCTLRTGTLILLYLSLISSLLTPFSKAPEVTTTDSEGHRQKTVQDYPLGVKISTAVIGIIVSVAGLYGVYTERHGFLIPYLVLETLVVVGLIIMGIIMLLINILIGLIYFILIFPFIYFWLVVYNHFREIQEGKGGSSSA